MNDDNFNIEIVNFENYMDDEKSNHSDILNLYLINKFGSENDPDMSNKNCDSFISFNESSVNQNNETADKSLNCSFDSKTSLKNQFDSTGWSSLYLLWSTLL